MSAPASRPGGAAPVGRAPRDDAPLPATLGLAGRVAVIALMALGSVSMWIVVPVGLLYVVSQMVDTTQPSMGPYLVVLVGVPIGMTLIGKGLGALDRYYSRRTGTLEERRQRAWLRSMRGERKDAHAAHWKVLDVVMIWSVSTALLCTAIWFFFFAGPSI